MKPLAISNAKSVIKYLHDEIRRDKDSRYNHKLHAILLVAQGMSCRQVARLMGDGPRIVANWVRKFETKGLGRLMEQERLGRKQSLNDEQIQEIEKILQNSPQDVDLPGLKWNGKRLSQLIQEMWSIKLGVRQCQRLIRQFGPDTRKRVKKNSEIGRI